MYGEVCLLTYYFHPENILAESYQLNFFTLLLHRLIKCVCSFQLVLVK